MIGARKLLLALAAFRFLGPPDFALFKVLTNAFPCEEKNHDNRNDGKAIGDSICKEKTSHSPVRKSYEIAGHGSKVEARVAALD